MKVSIDNVLGSAQQINSRMRQDAENTRTSETRNDSVHINSRVDQRIGQLESELRTVQDSLSRHQVTLDGLQRLRDDVMNGGGNQQEILNNTRFGGQVLLSEFSIGDIDLQLVNDRIRDVSNYANQDHANLKRMLVEVDNIMAADMISAQRANELISGVQNEIARDVNVIEAASNVNASNVKNLIG